MNDQNPAPLWIGVQDFADTAVKWLDAGVSFSWLRTFEDLSATVKPMAYLREPHYTYDMASPLRGVLYRFRKSPFSSWVDEITDYAPRVILYNLCEYAGGAQALSELKRRLPEAKHILRLHHEPRYLLCHPGFLQCLLSVDIAIAPTKEEKDPLQSAGFQGPIEILPFGVDTQLLSAFRLPFKERDYDFVCANGTSAQKNGPLLKAVFETLSQRGYKTRNFYGLSPIQLAKSLGRSKVFFQPSMTEASGSRVLLEAIAAGCHPVAVAESPTTAEVAKRHGGHALTTGISYDFASKKMRNPDDAHVRITDQLCDILSERSSTSAVRRDTILADEYDEKTERDRLSSILLMRAGSLKWTHPLCARAAELLLSAIGEGGNMEIGPVLIQRASAVACNTRYAQLAGKVAEAICSELGCPEGSWGLSKKIFSPSFSFDQEINWILSQVRRNSDNLAAPQRRSEPLLDELNGGLSHA